VPSLIDPQMLIEIEAVAICQWLRWRQIPANPAGIIMSIDSEITTWLA